MRNVFAILFVILSLENAVAEQHAHHHEQQVLTLNNGKKWSVDQTMSSNMATIHKEFSKVEILVSTKKVKQNDYTQLSTIISDSAQKIVASCKMEEKADQTFHAVLADLLAVADDVKDMNKASHAMETLKHALKTYTEHFEQSFPK